MKINLPYKIEVSELDSNNIDEFVLLENKRRIRSLQVSKLRKLIQSGEHFDSPIVVSRNGKLRVIDGSHRMSAIRKAIELDPDFKIEVVLVTYKDLDEKQEREIFNRWNIGTRQSSDDFVKMHAKEIGILKKFEKDFPVGVSIYREPEKLHFKLLVGSYIAAKKSRFGGYSGSNEQFVADSKDLDGKDYEFLKKYVSEFLNSVEGSLDRSNIWLKTTPFGAIAYLYYHNRDKVDSNEFWDRFKRKVKSDSQVIQLSLSGGIKATQYVTNMMLDLMNSVSQGVELSIPIQRTSRTIIFEEDEE